MRVALLVTCLIDVMRPEIGFSVVKLLEAAGCQVDVPADQTCCGQPAFSAGDFDTARELARNIVRQFESYDYVVVPSGSCGGTIRTHYDELLANDPVWRERAARLAERTYELTDFLTKIAPLKADPAAGHRPALGVVTYHDSCCGLRELGVERQPRELLKQVGVEVVEMEGCRECCGFGGSFSVKFGDISTAIADEKCKHIAECGASSVVLGDLGCMLNIEGRLRRLGDASTRVLHVAQVLAGDV